MIIRTFRLVRILMPHAHSVSMAIIILSICGLPCHGSALTGPSPGPNIGDSADILMLNGPGRIVPEIGGNSALIIDGDKIRRIRLLDGAVIDNVLVGLTNPRAIAILSEGTDLLLVETIASTDVLSRVTLPAGTKTPLATGFNSVGNLVVEQGDLTALVIDQRNNGTLSRIDLTTGEVAAITSGFSTAPLVGLALDPNGTSAYVLYGMSTFGAPVAGLVRVDLSSASKTIIPASLDIPAAMAVEPVGNTVIVVTMVSYGPRLVKRVDLTTGSSEVLFSTGTPSVGSYSLGSIAVEPGQASALMTTGGVLTQSGILRLNLATKQVNVVAHGVTPQAIATEESGETALVVGQGGIYRVGLGNGLVQLIRADLPADAAIEPSGATALYTWNGYFGSYGMRRVDLTTGSTQSITTNLSNPYGLAIEPGGSTALVIERGTSSVARVNLVDGSKVTLATGLVSPGCIVMEPGTNAALLTQGSSLREVTRLDLTTGHLATIASTASQPNHLCLESGGNTVLLTAAGQLFRVDIPTGSIQQLTTTLSQSSGVAVESGGLTALVGSGKGLKRVRTANLGSLYLPVITQTPMSGPPGTTFVQQGTGFTPGGRATLHAHDYGGIEGLPISQPIDSRGHFQISYSVPAEEPAGLYTWWAVDDATGTKTNEVRYEILPSSACNPSISGWVTDTLATAIADAQVTVWLGGAPVAGVLTDANGRFHLDVSECNQNYQVVASKAGNQASQTVKVGDFYGGNVTLHLDFGEQTQGTPVILIPGFMGSTSGGILYPTLPASYPAEGLEIYDPLLNRTGFGKLRNLLEHKGYKVFDCPWDWRVGFIAATYKNYLKSKIDEALLSSLTGKVHIVAHSMGGLVVRRFIQSNDYDDYRGRIDKVAFVGTPHLGSAIPYYMQEGGDPILADVTKGNLPDIREGGTFRPYTNVLKRLWEDTYRKGSFPDYMDAQTAAQRFQESLLYYALRPEIRSFIRGFVPGGGQLMMSNPSGSPMDLENTWLTALNAESALARLATSGITPKIFLSHSVQTVGTISVDDACPTCSLYEHGKPVTETVKDVTWVLGDGTVTEESARWLQTQPGLTGIRVEHDQPGEHMKLIDIYADSICAWLLGNSCSTPQLARRSSAETESPILALSINGPVAMLITDPLGLMQGFDISLGAPVQEIPGATLSYGPSGGTVVVSNPSAGNYLATFTGDPPVDFQFRVQYQGVTIEKNVHREGFYSDRPLSLTVTLDPAASEVITVTPLVEAPSALTAEPYDAAGTMKTRLVWTAPGDDAGGYRIYTRGSADYYFKRIDTTVSGIIVLDTDIAWSGGTQAIPVSRFAVTALNGTGDESFFSEEDRNDDRDHDGLSDEREAELETDPAAADSDGDGYGDLEEIVAGSSPLDPGSIPNHAPVLDWIGPRTLGEGATLLFTVTASDQDDGQTLTLAAEPLPAGAAFDPVTGLFAWTPGYNQAGDCIINFAVCDNGLPSRCAAEVMTISVTHTNRAPVLDPIGPKSVAEGQLLSFTVTGSDLDGDTLTFSAPNLPPGARFDPATRTLAWTPGYDQAGSYPGIQFELNDGNLVDTEAITITVTHTNRAPVLDPIGPKSVAEGQLLSFTVTGSDLDGDTLTFSAPNLPPGARFDPATRTLAWTPGYDQAGSYPGIQFIVSDGTLTDSEEITLTVQETYSIKGRVVTYLGAPLRRVTVNLTPDGGSLVVARTDSLGRYTFAGLLSNTNYTIRPVKTGWYFRPRKKIVLIENASLVKQNFTALAR